MIERRGGFGSGVGGEGGQPHQVLVVAAARLPDSGHPYLLHHMNGDSIGTSSTGSKVEAEAAAAAVRLQDPLLAALAHICEARGLPVSFVLVPGSKPSWRSAQTVTLDCATRLGAALTETVASVAPGLLSFDRERCSSLEIAHPWF